MAKITYSDVVDTFITYLGSRESEFFNQPQDKEKKDNLAKFIERLNEVKSILTSNTRENYIKYFDQEDFKNELSTMYDSDEQITNYQSSVKWYSELSDLTHSDDFSYSEFKIIKKDLYKLIAGFNNHINKNFPNLLTSLGRSLYEAENSNYYDRIFLSYAYEDKFYTLALFVYFLVEEHVFLSIDWMQRDKLNNGIDIKEALSHDLEKSTGFLLLRSLHSELRISGNQNFRQWCSWEIGAFPILHNSYHLYQYGSHQNNMHYTNYLSTKFEHNPFIDDLDFIDSTDQI